MVGGSRHVVKSSTSPTPPGGPFPISPAPSKEVPERSGRTGKGEESYRLGQGESSPGLPHPTAYSLV